MPYIARRGSAALTEKEKAIPENKELLSAPNLATRRKSDADLLEHRLMEIKSPLIMFIKTNYRVYLPFT